MAKNSNHLRAADLRAAYLLVGECCELGADALVWRRHLLVRLSELLGAVASIDIEARVEVDAERKPAVRVEAAVTLDGYSAQEREILTRCLQQLRLEDNALGTALLARSRQKGIVAGTRRELVDDSTWERCKFAADYMNPLGWRDHLMAVVNKPNGLRTIVCSTQGRNARFQTRSARLLELITRELVAIPAARLAPLDAGSLLCLPRRLRQVAEGLAAGDNEKQIAMQLGIARSTVHEYVGRLFATYQVSSRGQLLTRLARQLHALEVSQGSEFSNCWFFQQSNGAIAKTDRNRFSRR